VALKVLEQGVRLTVRGAVHYPGDAHLSPHILMNQMIDHLRKSGVEFIDDSEVINVEEKSNEGVSLHLKDESTIQSRYVVIATGSWSGILMKKSGYRLPMQDGKGYSMTIQQPRMKPTIPAILTEARVAITPMGESLRIAGTLEISGMDDTINPHKVQSILDAAGDYYPDLKSIDGGPVWFGYRPCPPDGLPYIGRWKENSSIVLATGHGMMGLSLAPATGRMVRDIIFGKKFFDPSRKLNTGRFEGSE
jgi:D-amino-acid dehydrogenase